MNISQFIRKLRYALLIFTLAYSGLSIAENNITAVNLHWAKDYLAPVFADAMMTARDWDGVTFGSGLVQLDGDGWPITDCGIVFWSGYVQREGTYKLQFTGQANLAFEWTGPGSSIANKVYNAETNITTADINYKKGNQNGLRIRFTSTMGGVKNLKLMRPIDDGSTTAHDFNETFDRNMKSLLSRFDVIRYMDFTETNSNPQVSWTHRTLPEGNQRSKMLFEYNNKQVPKGVAWEYVIMLSNETGTSPWINIPHLADDNYVSELAKLFKNGGGVYPALNSNLDLYVEYSNELWNTGSAFPQTKDLANRAVNAVRTNINHPINYDGICVSTDSVTVEAQRWKLFPRMVGYRSAQISQILRNVMGNAQMMSRIKPLLCWQVKGSGSGLNTWGSQELNFVDDYFGKVRTDNPTPRQVNHFYWGGGSAGYYSPSDTCTINSIWNSKSMDPIVWAPVVQYASALTSAFGMKLVFYEGGPGFGDALGGSGSNPIGETVWNDPQMQNEMIEHHNVFSAGGGKIFNYYVLNHDYRWKFVSSADGNDANSYKMKAIDQLRTQTTEPLTEGDLVPVTMWGGDFDAINVANKLNNSGYHNRTAAYSLRTVKNEWTSYRIRSNIDANYRLAIEYSTSTESELQIDFNGNKLSTLMLNNTSNLFTKTPEYVIPMVANELYAVRIRNTGNADIKINKVIIEQEITANMDNLNKNKFSIYPNPAVAGSVRIVTNMNSNELTDIEVFNIWGQKLHLNMKQLTTNEIIMNTSGLEAGTYFLIIKSKNQIVAQKLIVSL